MFDFSADEIIKAYKEIELEKKEIEFRRFQKIIWQIENILESREIDPRELFELLYKAKLKKIEDEMRIKLANEKIANTVEPSPEQEEKPDATPEITEVTEKKKPEKEKSKEEKPVVIPIPIANAELIISKINERQSSFEEMQKKITKDRTHHYPEKHTIAAKIKALILMRMLDFSQYGEFAKWIKNNENLFKNLGFGEIPEKESAMITLLYCFNSSWMECIREDTERIITEIDNELKNPVNNNRKPKEDKEKQEEQEEKKSNVKESLPTEEKKSIVTSEPGAKLVISKINERQSSFEQMQKEMLEKMGPYSVHQNKKYPLVLKLKVFTIMEVYGFHSYTRLADWIKENEELVRKDLGFENLPETKTGISNAFYQSEHTIRKCLPEGEIKKIARKITDEIKNSEERKEEWKPICHNCKTSAFLVKDKEWEGHDEEKQAFRWICTKCKNTFLSRKRVYGNKNEKIDVSLDNLEKLKEEKMKNHAWGLYNLNGYKDYKEISFLINKKFPGYALEKTVSQWIQEKIAERNGLTCGQMDCFTGKNENLSMKNCETVKKMRGKDEYICDTKLKELVEKGDSRLNLAQFSNNLNPLTSHSI